MKYFPNDKTWDALKLASESFELVDKYGGIAEAYEPSTYAELEVIEDFVRQRRLGWETTAGTWVYEFSARVGRHPEDIIRILINLGIPFIEDGGKVQFIHFGHYSPSMDLSESRKMLSPSTY